MISDGGETIKNIGFNMGTIASFRFREINVRNACSRERWGEICEIFGSCGTSYSVK